MDSIISITNKPDWKRHIYNLTARKDLNLESLFHSDILGLEAMFDYWYSRKDVLCIRYDQIYENIKIISEYTGIDLELAPYRKRKSNWKAHARKEELLKVYGKFHDKIKNNDSKLPVKNKL